MRIRLRVLIALVFSTLAPRTYALSTVVFNNDAPAPMQTDSRYRQASAHLNIELAGALEELHLTVGQSLIITTPSALHRVYIGDGKIITTFASGSNEEVITAKSAGVSTVVFWIGANDRRIYTIYADLDGDGVGKAIRNALPDSHISITARGDKLYLFGTARAQSEVDEALHIASSYTKDVINGVQICSTRAQQVQLRLRIVEIDRSRLEQFGLNFFAPGSSLLAGSSTQQFATTVVPASASVGSALSISDPLNLLLYSAKLNAGVTIQDLEQHQLVQVLAEPTITTTSGVEARFLSGGEFPLPVVQGGTGNSTAITIVFKPYGVKVDFTPTVNRDGTIHLKVAPEVSSLDYTNAVTISGFTIPALSTRRAETEVELKDGQSFILSGLLDRRTMNNLSRMPGISDVPILGSLFRSKNISKSLVDLMVIATATVVDSTSPTSQGEEPKMVVPNLSVNKFDSTTQQNASPSSLKHRP